MSINKVILVGNVGKDPEIRYFDNDRAVANFSLATNERGYNTTNGVQVPDRTEWHNIVIWRKGLVEIVEKYLRKGSKIYIEGKIRTRSYENGQSVKRYVTEIYADNIELLDRKLDVENKSSFSEFSIETNSAQKTITNPPMEQEEDDLPF